MENSKELAFPASRSWRDEQPEIITYDGGLTKREYFAAMAMQGYLASYPPAENPLASNVARFAVAIADELLKKLEENPVMV